MKTIASRRTLGKESNEINLATFEKCWSKLDKTLPDLSVSEEDIMKQVKAIRKAHLHLK